jgi:hypothetical protein
MSAPVSVLDKTIDDMIKQFDSRLRDMTYSDPSQNLYKFYASESERLEKLIIRTIQSPVYQLHPEKRWTLDENGSAVRSEPDLLGA